jgi:DNA-binding transcriptional regulator YiaG
MSWTPERIRALRTKLGLKQIELADLLGIHAITISRWEQGHYEPSSLAEEKLDKLARKADRKKDAE